MPNKLRIVARFSSVLIIAASMYARWVGEGISCTVPSINSLLFLSAFAWQVYDFGKWCNATKVLAARIALGVVTGALVVTTIVIGLLSFIPIPKETIGQVPASRGQVIAYLVSMPLVDDFVVIEHRITLIPGFYAYKIRTVLDPAWDPKVQRKANSLIISYQDEAQDWHQMEVRP
jgi:hypothetical protein